MSQVRKFKDRLDLVRSKIEALRGIKPLADSQEEYLDKLYEEEKTLEQLLKGF